MVRAMAIPMVMATVAMALAAAVMGLEKALMESVVVEREPAEAVRALVAAAAVMEVEGDWEGSEGACSAKRPGTHLFHTQQEGLFQQRRTARTPHTKLVVGCTVTLEEAVMVMVAREGWLGCSAGMVRTQHKLQARNRH